MSIRARTLIAAALLAGPAGLAHAQRTPEQTSDFKWGDRIEAGRWVRAGNVNGRITVRQGSGDRVEVTAVKRWRRGDPASVRVEARKVGSDIEICALYEDQRACGERHESRGWRNRWNDDDRNDDVSVDFTILLPQGVRLRVATVNGSVDVSGATTDLDASTVNGEMIIEAGAGPLRASTVNGSVRARITSVASDSRSMDFTTVNGSVIAEFPPNLGADVSMTTVNGDLRSDFDLTIRGRIDPHNLSMHVGPAGGPSIRLTTVNGSVELRRR